MGTITGLWLLLLVLMLAVGGKQGISSFLSLLVNFGILFFSIVLISFQFNPLAVGIVASVVLLAITIFWSSASDTASMMAFWSSLIVMVILIVVIVITSNWAAVGGFGLEDSEELEGLTTLIGINFTQIAMVTTLLSSLGAISEAAIAIASGLDEITSQHPQISAIDLTKDGIQIGHQIIGTALNTLFFGFFGSSLALFIWLTGLDYSLGEIINDKVFATELMAILIAVLGVILTIPITAHLMSRHWSSVVTKQKKD
ncbi:multitransmembrane protein [Lentilactobacillus senioris DSM 24302 = JCM 17472]|uniref:Multitransmembrane protein n=1 Tax=Lentilactobacillus senioris DSM 24302 = JCM 17472 TaxID=1423802 RepID=A0A0R2CYT7_9LACO|nr:YibE/F family protein [Lentilactobacillus senioris]KRM93259.1 multitransmembrane protein [Lentilactobacillus senioris DSM 24302 = JCM 17472]